MKRSTLLLIFCLAVIAINLFRTILPIQKQFLDHSYWKRYPSLKKTYYDSVYANKNGPFIPDQYVYSFAAGSLLKGVSPVLVNPETPPLGKYLIGLSIILFNNEHEIILVCEVLSLILLYLVGMQVFKNRFWAVLPPVILSFEPLFLNQLKVSPLLDIIQLVFLLGFFFFFNKAFESKRQILYFFLSSVMIGGFISTKFFGTGVTLVGAAVIVFLFRRAFRSGLNFFMTLLIAPVILLSNYLKLFFTGYSLRSFLGVQKWIWWYNQGHLTKLFTFFPLFLFNIWYSWWDSSVMSDAQWRITWPISFVAFIVLLFLYLKNKKYRNKALDIVIAWIVLYLLILQTGYTSARYFVILLPPLFLCMVYTVKQFILISTHKEK